MLSRRKQLYQINYTVADKTNTLLYTKQIFTAGPVAVAVSLHHWVAEVACVELP